MSLPSADRVREVVFPDELAVCGRLLRNLLKTVI